MSNLNQSPQIIKYNHLTYKKMELAMPVKPHYSHVALITYVFEKIMWATSILIP